MRQPWCKVVAMLVCLCVGLFYWLRPPPPSPPRRLGAVLSSEALPPLPPVIVYLTNRVDDLQARAVAKLNEGFPGQLYMLYDGSRQAATEHYPDLDRSHIICSEEMKLSYLSTMYNRLYDYGKSIRYKPREEIEGAVRLREMLYSWLLLDPIGRRVTKVLAIDREVYFTDINVIRLIFDRFSRNSVDFLYQEPMHLNFAYCPKCFMQRPPAVLPAAALQTPAEMRLNAGHSGRLDMFGASRQLLDALARWVRSNKGELTLDEVLLGPLVLKNQLSGACWQAWLGGDMHRRTDFMRPGPAWTRTEMLHRVHKKSVYPGYKSHGYVFYPVHKDALSQALSEEDKVLYNKMTDDKMTDDGDLLPTGFNTEMH
eukprot:TRINITY_DN3714_c0_g2_i3.p1 TRINITY_DN3714_c0_g2~~TRINITY_DN3714_c0_g2_i3.p1  ORF type:complete len:369 (-),score=60.81 TRINITY_DN3714_c0_g2_i3:112-1218(-)